MDIFTCLAFIPQKWALGSSAGTLAKGQEVSSEWEVKRWGCEQHKYSLARKSKHVTAAAGVQIDVLGCKPSPLHPCSAAGSLCPPDPLGSAWQVPLTADRSSLSLPCCSLTLAGLEMCISVNEGAAGAPHGAAQNNSPLAQLSGGYFCFSFLGDGSRAMFVGDLSPQSGAELFTT